MHKIILLASIALLCCCSKLGLDGKIADEEAIAALNAETYPEPISVNVHRVQVGSRFGKYFKQLVDDGRLVRDTEWAYKYKFAADSDELNPLFESVWLHEEDKAWEFYLRAHEWQPVRVVDKKESSSGKEVLVAFEEQLVARSGFDDIRSIDSGVIDAALAKAMLTQGSVSQRVAKFEKWDKGWKLVDVSPRD